MSQNDWRLIPGQPLNLENVCGGEKSNLYGPFLLQISNYWPKMIIYDQQKYKVFEFSIIQNEQTSNSCPKATFLFNDQCYTTCPSPYYHQMSGHWGTCVLNCESGSIIDQNSMTCKCPNRDMLSLSTYSCINGSLPYPYGCYCQNGTFFDKNTYSCLPSKFQFIKHAIVNWFRIQVFAFNVERAVHNALLHSTASISLFVHSVHQDSLFQMVSVILQSHAHQIAFLVIKIPFARHVFHSILFQMGPAYVIMSLFSILYKWETHFDAKPVLRMFISADRDPMWAIMS